MKHCILAKYRPEVYPRREELLPRIREIFAPAAELPGVHRITVYPNCVARENRYDVLIVLDMASEALPVYDASAPHRLWKEEFGPLLAQKLIGGMLGCPYREDQPHLGHQAGDTVAENAVFIVEVVPLLGALCPLAALAEGQHL